MIQQDEYIEEIYQILSSNKDRWFSQSELKDLVGVTRTTACLCLIKLVKSNHIEVKDELITKFNEFWGRTQNFHIKCYKYKDQNGISS